MRIIKTPTAVTPRYSDAGSAGMDIYIDTAEETEIQPGQFARLTTGLDIEIPKNCVGLIYPKSGLWKKGLELVGSPVVINPGDRGEIMLTFRNIFSDVVRFNGQYGIKTPVATLIVHQYRYEKIEIDESTLDHNIIP